MALIFWLYRIFKNKQAHKARKNKPKFQSKNPQPNKKKSITRLARPVLLIGSLGVGGLVLTGKISWIVPVFAGGLALGRTLVVNLMRYAPLVLPHALRWYSKQTTNSKTQSKTNSNNAKSHYYDAQDKYSHSKRSSKSSSASNIGLEEAQKILNVAPGASVETIKKAHKSLILKLHPDKGGNDFLASKINAARDLLLKDSN